MLHLTGYVSTALTLENIVSDCKLWTQKQSGTKPKGVAFIQSPFVPDNLHPSQTSFEPFIIESVVALSDYSDFKSIVMLRDTGSAQSLILESVTFLVSVIHRYRCLNPWCGIRLCTCTST